jgi:hypothetical protein
MVSATSAFGRTACAWPGLARPGIAVLICCCAGLSLSACSGGSGTKSPDTGVTAPSVGKPAMATSVGAALAKQAFTPYAGLGIVAGDGLAPNETSTQLAAACMTDAGHADDAADVAAQTHVFGDLLGLSPFGRWGYVGTTQAAQYGFEPGPGDGLGLPPGTGSSDLSDAAQAAVDKCANILTDFSNAQDSSSLAGIQNLIQAIGEDELKDPSIMKAIKAWSACMTANGYHYPDPTTLLEGESNVLNSPVGSSGPTLTTAQKAAQIAVAEADAACTQSTDLAGIWFAVQADYEQQIVGASQQQLSKAVQQYRAAYQKELGNLRTLLTTAPTTPPGNGPKA